MFKSLKLRIIIIAILIVGIVLIVWLTIYSSSRSRDLQIVSQAKTLATSMEKYYDKFNVYPASTKVPAEEIAIISDKGINQSGRVIYYQANFKWAKAATFSSDGHHYVIVFEIDNSWPAWNLPNSKGGKCQIADNVVLQCSSNQ